MALLAGLEGQHLLQTDLEAWRRRVLGSPWVEQATLRRVLPSTVEVTIRERLPIAIGRIRGDLYLVDEQGLVIDEYGPNYAQFDLPIVDGLADAGAGEPAIDPARAGLAADLLRALEQQPVLMKRISQIDVASAHDAVVLLDQDPALVHLGDEQFVQRLQRYLELHEALHSRVPTSSTSISGSTTASTCGLASRRRCKKWAVYANDVRQQLEDVWDVRIDIWSGSTSARRRSAPSSASFWTMAASTWSASAWRSRGGSGAG